MWYDSQIAIEYSVLYSSRQVPRSHSQFFPPPARYLDICIWYYYISRWYIGYRWDRYYIMYLSQVLCNIVSVSMVLFCFLCWGVWEVPGIYSRYLVGIYSIRYTCMKAYIKRIMIKFILQMNFFVRQASSFRIRSQIVTMSRISDFIIFQYYMYLDIWDNVIRDMVYIIRTSDCEMIYLILFVGWVCLWAWQISSFRIRMRIVPTDRIIRIM